MSTLRQHKAGNPLGSPPPSKKPPVQQRPRIVIVGGGPAGAVTAKYLADTGLYDVHLLEAYPHPNQISKNSPKAYAIALGGRGQRGIRDCTGIVPSSFPGTVLSTRVTRHPSDKAIKHEKDPSLIAPRQALASHLLDEAEKAGATVSFQQKLTSVDFKNRVVHFESQGSAGTDVAQVQVPYDLLIGADGCKSTVRTILDGHAQDFCVQRIEEDSMEYQVVTIPSPFEEGKYPDDSVHVWN
jgi:2-polyprenyl-6-methoxyphenol hydroxylase-like FAD-dependent oxidoreductase